MRLYLDPSSGEVRNSLSPFDQTLARFSLSVGSRPLGLYLRSGIPFGPLLSGGALVNPATVQFAADQIDASGVTLFDGGNLVAGTLDLTTAAAASGLLDLGEDWSAAPLLALFTGNKRSVSLTGQYRFRNGGETGWTYSPLLAIAVLNTVFTAELVPGSLTVLGFFYYFPGIDSLRGAATSAEALVSTRLPLGSLLKFSIGGSTSEWKVVVGAADPTYPADELAFLDYDAASNNKHLAKEGGL